MRANLGSSGARSGWGFDQVDSGLASRRGKGMPVLVAGQDTRQARGRCYRERAQGQRRDALGNRSAGDAQGKGAYSGSASILTGCAGGCTARGEKDAKENGAA